MTRMAPNPICLLTFDSATNFSTIGRAFAGLQYMMSRTRNMLASFGRPTSILDRWWRGDAYERRSSARWYAQRRVHADVRRTAEAVGRERTVLWRVGDLSPQRIAGPSEPILRVAVARLVRPDHPALE